MQGEVVVHRARLHKIIFLKSIFFAIVFFCAGIAIQWHFYEYLYAAYGCFLLALIFLLPAFIHYISCEYAVTNKRVIIKTGFIYRQTMETLLQKIEAINVDQSIIGRLFNYGTIIITGTGGTKEAFESITDPLTFRRVVQEQTDAKENDDKNND
jgi:uncharacterized membrane protein YdbT with pleckstrin-like domain